MCYYMRRLGYIPYHSENLQPNNLNHSPSVNIESSTKLALGAAACAAFLVLVLWLLGRLLYKAATGKEEATPTYRPFSNIITLTILMFASVSLRLALNS